MRLEFLLQYSVKVREDLLQVSPPVSYSFAIVTHKSISTKKGKRGKKVHQKRRLKNLL